MGEAKIGCLEKRAGSIPMLEEIIRDEVSEDYLDQALTGVEGSENYEIDFEPVEPEKGLLSDLIRV